MRGGLSPAFVLTRHPPCRILGGRTHRSLCPFSPQGSHSSLSLSLPGRLRHATPAGLQRGREAAGGRGVSEGGRGRRGVEASADGGGLLVHYKITKNKWKQLRGSRVNKVNETKLAAISGGSRAPALTPRCPARGLGPGGSEQRTKASGRGGPARPLGALPRASAGASGLDQGPPAPRAPQVRPNPG